jgi:signal transduction histidine kinase
MRHRVRSCLLAIAFVLVAPAWVGSTAPAQTAPPRNVLTIHWGAEDFPGTAVFDAAIRDVLHSNAAQPVNYFAEYLESEVFPAETASLGLHDYIRQKFTGRRIDVVIANTTPALEFVLSYRDELFAGVPVVFVAGQLPDAALERPGPGLTGVVSDVAFAETVELALKLHPAVRRVFVVAQAPTNPEYLERVQSALKPFSPGVRVEYIREKTVPRLLEAVKAIPDRSLLFYTRYTPEDAASVVYTDEIARLISQASAVPVYSTTDLYIGTGVVGGVMRGSRATGTRIGEMAREILNGTSPENIPIERVRLVPTFDWRQVKRWGIDPSQLPPGSDIQLRTPTAWESYRWYIVGTIVLVTSQMLLIAGLLTHRARRRRAEETIRAREATLRASYQRIRHLAGRIINEQEIARASIARDLHDDLCQKLVYVSMGVTGLKGSSAHIQEPQTQEALSELERDTNAVFDGIRRLSHDLHPATLRLLGLVPALKTYCAEVAKRHDVEVNLTTGGDVGRLDPDVAVCFFRIAEEAIRNGRVHGGARRFAVSVTRSGEDLELSVTDDGPGFDLEAVRRDGNGLGLVSMEERAHLAGAEVHIATGPGEGTTIRVRGPAELPRAAFPDEDFAAESAAAERLPTVG